MPWKEISIMSSRLEFVNLAGNQPASMRELCRRFRVSPTTGYKWLRRWREGGQEALADRSRRPGRSPRQTAIDVEHAVVSVRQEHRGWGGRKIRHCLQQRGHAPLPAASTISDILRRHGQLDPQESAKRQPWVRFEHENANDLWQMDFKGPLKLPDGLCHPLTMLDDRSRFNIGLRACADQKRATVQGELTGLFRTYGLPWRILCDNGNPWGVDREHPHTQLTAWLIRLGVGVCHGRPFHPQTQGKVERFHGSLEVELLRGRSFRDRHDLQRQLDHWRDTYNLHRPHEALGMATPAGRYEPSARAFPEELPPIEYGPGDTVCKVLRKGHLYYKCRAYFISEAFQGQPVALRPTTSEAIMDVYFCQQRVAQIDVRAHTVIR